MSKRKAIAKSGSLFKMKRSGMILIALLAVMILVINIITFSYSWFSPQIKKATSVSYDAQVTVRSENCSMHTYKGIVTDGAITYSHENINDVSSSTVAVTSSTTRVGNGQQVLNDGIQYFQTVITNNDTNPTNVSLFTKSLTLAASSSVGLGIAKPSNAYHVYTATQSDLYIVRNAHINGNGDEEGDTLTVEWFVKVEDGSVTIDFSDLYITYN